MPTLLEWLTAGGGGAAIMKTADVVVSRVFRPRDKAADTAALVNAADALDRRLKASDARQDKLEKDVQAVRDDLDDCHAAHERCERGREEDRKKIEKLEEEVRRFMAGDGSGQVAAYEPGSMRRPTRKAQG